MDVDQLIAELAQLGGRSRSAVDPGAAAALVVDHAAQQQFRLLRKAGLFQPGLQ